MAKNTLYSFLLKNRKSFNIKQLEIDSDIRKHALTKMFNGQGELLDDEFEKIKKRLLKMFAELQKTN